MSRRGGGSLGGAGVGLGVGVAGLGASVVLFLLDEKRKDGPVDVQIGDRSITLRGEF